MLRPLALLGLGLVLVQGCAEAPSGPGPTAAQRSTGSLLGDETAGGDRPGRSLDFGRPAADLRHVGHPGLTLKVRGKFKTALNPDAGNLPAVNYPLPELFGGRFEGQITLAADAVPEKSDVPTGAASYACASVDVRFLSPTGIPVHRITTGPNLLRRHDSNTRISLDLHPGAHVPALPGGFRLELDGFFKPRDGFAPTAEEINQSALRLGFVEIGGPSVGSHWVLDVELLEIAAFEGVEGA